MFETRRFGSFSEIEKSIGEKLGPTKPIQINSKQIKDFANATEDHQPIHLDNSEAKKAGYDGVLAHGYLLLSLLSKFSYELYNLQGFGPIINYGTDKVRFIRPVIDQDEISAFATPTQVQQKGEMVLVHMDYQIINQRQELVMAASTIIAVGGELDD